MGENEYLIELNGIHKAFGPKKVLNGVTLKVRRGETLVVIGQSGVGKSVSLRLIIGLLGPDQGTVLFEGKDISTFNRKELTAMRRRFAMLFQGGALFDSLTIRENVVFGLRALGETDEAKLEKVMEEKLACVGLGKSEFPEIPDKMPSQLSGGQRKRVALARSIAEDPEVVLYDEPTTGLDPIMSDAIADLILDTREALREKNATSIVVTHDMHVALKTADRIVMFHGGRIVGEGDPDHYRRIRDAETADNLNEEEKMIRQFVRGEAHGPIQAVQQAG